MNPASPYKGLVPFEDSGLDALLFFGRAQPVSFLAHTGFTTRADGNVLLGLANGLVLSMFTFTGYDASAHLAEETHDPARRTRPTRPRRTARRCP